MKHLEFFKIIILTLINLLAYLFSINFISSVYYIKGLTLFFTGGYEQFANKQNKEITISFSFHTLVFLGFIATIFIMIFRSDLTIETNENSEKNNNLNNDYKKSNNLDNIKEVEIIHDNIENKNIPNNNLDRTNIDYDVVLSSEQPQRNEGMHIQQIPHNNQEEAESKGGKINFIINMSLFFVCFFFYFLDLILISVNLSEFNKKYYDSQHTAAKFVQSIYTIMLVFGYIFFVVFVIGTLWVFLLTRTNYNCLPNFGITTWNYLDNFFDKYLKNTPELLEKNNMKMDEEIKKLEKKINEIEEEIRNDIY